MRSPATGRLPSSRPSLRLYYPAPSVSACYPKVQEFSYERSFRRISTESPSGSLPVTIVLTPRSPPPSNGFIVHGQMRREYIRRKKKELHKLLEYGSVASWRLYRRYLHTMHLESILNCTGISRRTSLKWPDLDYQILRFAFLAWINENVIF